MIVVHRRSFECDQKIGTIVPSVNLSTGLVLLSMEDWKTIIGANVKRLRKARGLTQEQLAVDSGIDLTYAGGIERGCRNPSVEVLIRIAAALETTPDELFKR